MVGRDKNFQNNIKSAAIYLDFANFFSLYGTMRNLLDKTSGQERFRTNFFWPKSYHLNVTKKVKVYD